MATKNVDIVLELSDPVTTRLDLTENPLPEKSPSDSSSMAFLRFHQTL